VFNKDGGNGSFLFEMTVPDLKFVKVKFKLFIQNGIFKFICLMIKMNMLSI